MTYVEEPHSPLMEYTEGKRYEEAWEREFSGKRN
jgi:hypothetical protein